MHWHTESSDRRTWGLSWEWSSKGSRSKQKCHHSHILLASNCEIHKLCYTLWNKKFVQLSQAVGGGNPMTGSTQNISVFGLCLLSGDHLKSVYCDTSFGYTITNSEQFLRDHRQQAGWPEAIFQDENDPVWSVLVALRSIPSSPYVLAYHIWKWSSFCLPFV